MKNLAMKVQRFLVSEDGPTAVEYAVMLALIVIVCLTAIRSIGTNANTTFRTSRSSSVNRTLGLKPYSLLASLRREQPKIFGGSPVPRYGLPPTFSLGLAAASTGTGVLS